MERNGVMNQEEERHKASVRAVERTIDVLRVFTAERHELSLAEICAAAELPKTTTYRILSTLERRNLLIFDSRHGKYRLGYELVRMGSIAQAGNTLQSIARDYMEWVTKRTGQTCNLYVRDGMDRRCIAQVEGTEYVRRFSYLGAKYPLYCGAGKILLAYSEPDFLQKYFDSVTLEQYTENTIVDKAALLCELEKIRRAGYSATKGERDALTAMVSVPLFDYTERVVATITVSGPVYLFSEENIQQYRGCLTEAAKQISAKLGYTD